jgi:hypothetical protein
MFKRLDYSAPLPKFVSDESSAFSNGPATPVSAAKPNVFRSVVPARYRARTAATAARA